MRNWYTPWIEQVPLLSNCHCHCNISTVSTCKCTLERSDDHSLTISSSHAQKWQRHLISPHSLHAPTPSYMLAKSLYPSPTQTTSYNKHTKEPPPTTYQFKSTYKPPLPTIWNTFSSNQLPPSKLPPSWILTISLHQHNPRLPASL